MAYKHKSKVFEEFISETVRSKMRLKQYEVQAEDVLWEKDSRQPMSKTLPLSRFIIIFIIVGFGLGAIIARTAYYQIIEGDKWRKIAEGNRIREIVLPARRGEIYDKNLVSLAKNIPAEDLAIIPGDFPLPEKFDEVAEYLAKEVSVPKQEIIDKINEIFKDENVRLSYDPVTLIENLQHVTALDLMVKSAQWPGLIIVPTGERYYPEKELISHSLGYIGKISQKEWDKLAHAPAIGGYLKSDKIGKTGLEYSYENLLRGEYGWKRIEVDSMGREQKVISETIAVSGKDLVSSIDALVQKKAYDALSDMIKKTGSKAGSAVAIDPRNGEIIAIANVPSYDNNIFSSSLTDQDQKNLFENNNRPLLFRAIAGIYPSGSIIKPLIASAALNEGVINENTRILSTGGISIGSSFFPDWKAGGHGSVDVKTAIAESVNTFFYTIGGGYNKFRGLGVDKLGQYMTMYNLGEKTGVDFPGEASGLVPTPSWKRNVKGEQWYIGDTYHLSIGQGDLLVTPLQMASVTATIANGGNIYTPHLIKGYLDNRNNNVINLPQTEPKKIAVSESALKIVQQGMRQTITSGSGRALASEPFEVAGKTGTAEAPSGNTHSWFIAFAPYQNPEIAVAVLIENGGEGHSAALPVAKQILEEYFKNKTP